MIFVLVLSNRAQLDSTCGISLPRETSQLRQGLFKKEEHKEIALEVSGKKVVVFGYFASVFVEMVSHAAVYLEY